MRFSHRTILCLLALAVPLGASAMVVAVNLGDVIGIVQTNKKPLAFDFAMRGTMGKTSATVAIKGTQNGNLQSLPKAALDATIVLDGKESTESWGHAEFRTRLVNETLYVRLDDFSAEGEWAAYINSVEPFMDVWYSFPLDPEEYEQFMKSQKKGRNASYKEIEALFEIVQEELRGGKTRYTLTIPKNRQRRLLSRILGPSYARTYRGASVDAQWSVDTLKNVFDAFTGSLDLKATVNGQKSTLKVTGSATTLKTVPVITAPAESTSFEDFVEELSKERYGNDEHGKPVSKTLEDARNAQRRSDVNTILNANYQYAIDHNGNVPKTLRDAGTKEVSICKTGKKICDGISLDTLTGSYLVSLPTDPTQDIAAQETGYRIQVGTNGRLTVSAPMAEVGASISVTR